MRFTKEIVLIIVIFLFMMSINLLNEGTLGGADSYMHFMMAKWSVVHPKLLFDHWGKPLFTIFSAPFAQLGFKGSVTFNIFISIFSGFLVFKIAKIQNLQHAWLGMVMTVFAPMYFLMALSSMTEVLFGFVLILSIYFWVSNKWFWSAFVISFIPFARTEGVIFIPLFLLALTFVKQYKYIPALGAGYLLMSVLGYPFYEDILWPIHAMPYGNSSGLYGSGDLFHFVSYSSDIFGWPLIISFLLGLVAIGWKLRSYVTPKFGVFIFLILSCSLSYFAAHSVVWAFGLGGSAGLTRVISGVVPLVAIVGLYGLNGLLQSIVNKKRMMKIVVGVLSILFFVEAVTKHKFPIGLGAEEVVIIEASEYIKMNNLTKDYVIYNNPFFAFVLDLDHFTIEKSSAGIFDKEIPSRGLKKGAIIIWDAHFSPNEGGLSMQALLDDTNLVRLADFQPKHAFTTYGNQQYEVVIFQKTGALRLF